MINNCNLKLTSFNDDELYSIMYKATHNGAFVSYIRGKYCPTVEAFFLEVSASLRFPSYFRQNWAAFDECITDLEWLKFTGLLIVVDDFDAIFKKEAEQDTCKQLLNKYLSIASEYWQSENVPIDIYLNN